MKKVVIMSGVSGSGKTTYAQKLKNNCIVSADHFFLQDDGSYKFEPAKLGEAHAFCFRSFIEFIRGWSESSIVVDNTNTTTEEISPYMLGAVAFGYEAEIHTITMKGNVNELNMLTKRNTHGVPYRTIAQQHEKLCRRILQPWWKHIEIPIELEGSE